MSKNQYSHLQSVGLVQQLLATEEAMFHHGISCTRKKSRCTHEQSVPDVNITVLGLGFYRAWAHLQTGTLTIIP
jgi:hypothetical protein